MTTSITRRAAPSGTMAIATFGGVSASAHAATPHDPQGDPRNYDWEAIYKVALRSFAHSGVDLNSLFSDVPENGNSADEQPLFGAGPRGAAAKAAIKAAIKALKGIGERAWQQMVAKLPLPDKVKKYLSYQLVMKVLNIALDFEGEVTESLKKALTSVGVPNWAAGIAARAIVTLLL